MPVWQKALDIVRITYDLVQQLPKVEQYALGLQIRNAAISIPANIAEVLAAIIARKK